MLTTPIIQFGTSRFLQAHAALFVSEALQVSQAAGQITVVQSSGDPTRAKRLSALAAPDGYPVHIRGLKNGIPVDDVQRVTSVARTLSTATDWAELSRVYRHSLDALVANTAYLRAAFAGASAFTTSPTLMTKPMTCGIGGVTVLCGFARRWR